MAFQDSYSRPDIGGINSARHRTDAAIAAQLALKTRVLDRSITQHYTVSDRWFHFTANGVRYSVSKKLINH